MPTKSTPCFTIGGGLAMLAAGGCLTVAFIVWAMGTTIPVRWDIVLPIIIGLGFIYVALQTLRR